MSIITQVFFDEYSELLMLDPLTGNTHRLDRDTFGCSNPAFQQEVRATIEEIIVERDNRRVLTRATADRTSLLAQWADHDYLIGLDVVDGKRFDGNEQVMTNALITVIGMFRRNGMPAPIGYKHGDDLFWFDDGRSFDLLETINPIYLTHRGEGYAVEFHRSVTAIAGVESLDRLLALNAHAKNTSRSTGRVGYINVPNR